MKTTASRMTTQRAAVNAGLMREAVALAKSVIEAERAEDVAQQEACQYGTWTEAHGATFRFDFARDAFAAHVLCARADVMTIARRVLREAA